MIAKVLYTRISADLYDAMVDICDERGVSIASFVAVACREYLSTHFGIDLKIGLP